MALSPVFRDFTITILYLCARAGIILGMRSANERRRYTVTPPLIGWAHTHSDPYRGAIGIRLTIITRVIKLTPATAWQVRWFQYVFCLALHTILWNCPSILRRIWPGTLRKVQKCGMWNVEKWKIAWYPLCFTGFNLCRDTNITSGIWVICALYYQYSNNESIQRLSSAWVPIWKPWVETIYD